MKRILFICFLTTGFLVSIAFVQAQDGKQQNISIRLFASYNISSVSFLQVSGGYGVYGDSIKLFDADKISFVTASLSGDSVLLETPVYSKKFHSVRFVPQAASSSFKLK